MRSIKLFGAILILWLVLSYFLITELYKKNLEQNHATVANVLSLALLQDTILNDQIKIKASISDFVKSVDDVSFVCMLSEGKISSYVGDVEINQRQTNEKNCLSNNISINRANVNHIINNHNIPIADLKIFWNQESLSFLWFKQNPAIFIGSIILLVLLLLIVKFLFNQEQASLLEHSIYELVKNEEPSEYLKGKFPFLASKWLEMKKTVDMYSNERVKHEKSASIAQLASQVSHDIRSPLSALNMIMGSLQGIQEEKRLIIRNATQRINDIANQLLQKSKPSSSESATSSSTLAQMHEPIMLLSLLDSIISEKRVQFREKMEIEIQGDLTQGYGLFTKIDQSEFSRVISNLINNSVEAFSNKGQIIIDLEASSDKENYAIISIKDNGKGIPPEVLSCIGQRGVTHGKDGNQSGTGLGVYHAIKTIEDAGGIFKISSQVGKGTISTIKLPRAKAPSWFIEKIEISQNMKIVSLDDDLTIHQIWSGRFKSIFSNSYAVEHLSFSSIETFMEWARSNKDIRIKFFIDYEFLDQKMNGLDVIEKLALSKQSILVTSRFTENHVHQRAESLGVKMLPKGLASIVPIEIVKAKLKQDAILIDDDPLVHSCWQMDAVNKNKSIVGFTNPAEFFDKAVEYDLNCKVFIDSNLGNGVKGETISKIIYEMGFNNIYLCTGYQFSDFSSMPWIKAIVGKEPQF